MTHSRPDTRPMPVMTPAPGASSSYIPVAASADSSRKGLPGSSSASTRSRGSSLPRATCRSRLFAGPPSRTVSSRSRRSAASPRLTSALRANASLPGSALLRSLASSMRRRLESANHFCPGARPMPTVAPRTRDVMLRQAARLFAERGFRGTSVEDLGSACGVSGPAVYKHFANKDEILARLLVDISEQLLEGGRQVVTTEPDPAVALLLLVEFHTDF